MNNQEAALQKKRIEKYDKLHAIRTQYCQALAAVTQDDPEGPSGQGPFTGNTRESREIASLHIKFTRTRGGAPAVDMFIGDLGIEAWTLGKCLEKELRAKIEEIDAELAKL